MKARLIFSVAAVGVTAAIGTASAAVAQEGPSTTPVGDPPAALAPAPDAGGTTGATGATGAADVATPDQADAASKDHKADVAKPAAKAKGAKLKLYAHQLKHGKVRVAKQLEVTGKVIPYVPKQRVQVALARNGHVIQKVNAKVKKVKHSPAGQFQFKTHKLVKSGTYKIRAHHALSKKQKAASKKIKSFHVSYPDLDPGDSGPLVKLMNKLLLKEGYYPSHGSKYSSRTARALLAFRKVNNMSRTFQANGSIFKMLAGHKGGFKLKYPDAGKHVEADLSRQVMVLANHGKAQAIFPISSGAPATPTIKGHFQFYRKDPGYNSERMYYSVYFIRGYATHGYDPVPTYNASHGCLRNPIPDSRFIYNWIDLGDSIYVYN